MFKKIFKPAISLMIICIITSTLIAVTNYVTKDKIAQSDLKASQEAQNIVLGYTGNDDVEFKDVDVDYNETTYTMHFGYVDNKYVGCAIKTASNGYGGNVSIMTGIDKNGSVIQIDVLDVSNETAGMGQNATNQSFTDQFKSLKNGIEVVKSGVSSNEIQAMTGATITSNAVTTAVNTALDIYEQNPDVGGEK